MDGHGLDHVGKLDAVSTFATGDHLCKSSTAKAASCHRISQRKSSLVGARNSRHNGRKHGVVHCCAGRAYQSAPPNTIPGKPERQAVQRADRLHSEDLSRTWSRWSVSRTSCNHHLSVFLLLLVGQLRCLVQMVRQEYQAIDPFHQLLGWRALRSTLLAGFLPLRRGQAAYHDRPTWWSSE